MSSLTDAPSESGAPAVAVLTPPPAPAFHVTATDLLLLGMATIWGVNFVVMKFGAAAFSPLAFNALRVALAAVALAAIAFAPGARRPAWPDAKRLMLLGLLGHALYQLLFLNGLHLARAGTASLIIAGTPALIAILLWVTGQERITRRAAVGIVLSLAGIGLVVTAAAAPSATDDSPVGLAMILAASLCWAFYTLGLRPLTHRVDGVQIGAWTVFGAVGPMVLMGLPALWRTDFAAVTLAAWGAVFYSAFLAFVVAYLIWYRGVRLLGPVRTAMYANLQPIIALGFAWLVLHEQPTGVQFIGAACVIGGVYLSRT
jgi:drug/metabolite transporter (DMT)-like permease